MLQVFYGEPRAQAPIDLINSDYKKVTALTEHEHRLTIVFFIFYLFIYLFIYLFDVDFKF